MSNVFRREIVQDHGQIHRSESTIDLKRHKSCSVAVEAIITYKYAQRTFTCRDKRRPFIGLYHALMGDPIDVPVPATSIFILMNITRRRFH